MWDNYFQPSLIFVITFTWVGSGFNPSPTFLGIVALQGINVMKLFLSVIYRFS
jgi:hypothetical protein